MANFCEVRLNLLPGIIEELEMAIEGVKPEEVEDALERALVVCSYDANDLWLMNPKIMN